jgi:hypothetical protein
MFLITLFLSTSLCTLWDKTEMLLVSLLPSSRTLCSLGPPETFCNLHVFALRDIAVCGSETISGSLMMLSLLAQALVLILLQAAPLTELERRT